MLDRIEPDISEIHYKVNMEDLLNNTYLSSLVQTGRRVYFLEHNMSIGDALKALAKYSILSAPMVLMPDIEESAEIDTHPSLIGWLDIGDILGALLSHLSSQSEKLPSHMLSLMAALEKEGPSFANRSLITVPVAEDRGLLYEMDAPKTSLMTVIREAFVENAHDGKSHVNHRIALFDSHGEIKSIISQMDVIRWIVNQNINDPRLSQTVEELGLLQGKRPVVSVDAHMPTLTAYAKISSAGISGAPVITESGEVIANLSISDLRALTSEHFGVLALPVAEFLALEHHTAYIGYSVTSSNHSNHPFFASSPRKGRLPKSHDIQVFSISKDTTLGDALFKLCKDHIHRLYVVESDIGFPQVKAVITLTDVLQLISGVW